jgi:predicted nucleotidyltransferase
MLSPTLMNQRDAIHAIARSHGVVRLRLFGSQVHSTADDKSDIDLLVRLAPDRDLLDLIALKQDLEEMLARPVDVVEEDGLSPYLRERILSEAQEL